MPAWYCGNNLKLGPLQCINVCEGQEHLTNLRHIVCTCHHLFSQWGEITSALEWGKRPFGWCLFEVTVWLVGGSLEAEGSQSLVLWYRNISHPSYQWFECGWGWSICYHLQELREEEQIQVSRACRIAEGILRVSGLCQAFHFLPG